MLDTIDDPFPLTHAIVSVLGNEIIEGGDLSSVPINA